MMLSSSLAGRPDWETCALYVRWIADRMSNPQKIQAPYRNSSRIRYAPSERSSTCPFSRISLSLRLCLWMFASFRRFLTICTTSLKRVLRRKKMTMHRAI
jgi:hypothetical protein